MKIKSGRFSHRLPPNGNVLNETELLLLLLLLLLFVFLASAGLFLWFPFVLWKLENVKRRPLKPSTTTTTTTTKNQQKPNKQKRVIASYFSVVVRPLAIEWPAPRTATGRSILRRSFFFFFFFFFFFTEFPPNRTGFSFGSDTFQPSFVGFSSVLSSLTGFFYWVPMSST